MNYEAVIGLELHVQLATQTKMFCSCSTTFGDVPNSNTCPVCLGLPGALPVANAKAIEFAVTLGVATNCTINLVSEFARKNYFYPDLPKAYQTSQYENPICENGWISINVENKEKKIGITRIHIEEDAGKLIHENNGLSYIDLNRSGTPLLEIVSEPDIKTAAEAKIYMQKLHTLVTSLNICNGDMEKGNLRCDANISLRQKGVIQMGTRTETKNLNSFRFVQQAIDYEIARQQDVLVDGGIIQQETRLFNTSSKKTYIMRTKEDADDYRYFPCPDLPLVTITKQFISKIKEGFPELPDEKIKRYTQQYKLSTYDAEQIVYGNFSSAFENTIQHGVSAKETANWLMGDITRYINEKNIQLQNTKWTAEKLATIINLIEKGTISKTGAKNILVDILETDISVQSLIQEKNLIQVNDENELQTMCQEICSSHPEEVTRYKQGKKNVFGFLVGQAMQKTQGKGNPKIISAILQKILNE